MVDKTLKERWEFKRFVKENSVAILNSYFNTEKRVGYYGFEITPDGHISRCHSIETKKTDVRFVYSYSGCTVTHTEAIIYNILDEIISKLKRDNSLKVLLDD